MSKGQYERVRSYLAVAREEGLTFFAGGEDEAVFRGRLVGSPAVIRTTLLS